MGSPFSYTTLLGGGSPQRGLAPPPTSLFLFRNPLLKIGIIPIPGKGFLNVGG